jgi:hypothetical protein
MRPARTRRFIVTITIPLTPEVEASLHARAAEQGISLQEWATRILEKAADLEQGSPAWRNLNARRLTLISKEYSGELTDSENAELAALQEAAARASEPQDRRLLEQLRAYEVGTGHSARDCDA